MIILEGRASLLRHPGEGRDDDSGRIGLGRQPGERLADVADLLEIARHPLDPAVAQAHDRAAAIALVDRAMDQPALFARCDHAQPRRPRNPRAGREIAGAEHAAMGAREHPVEHHETDRPRYLDRKSTRLNSSHTLAYRIP